MQSVGSIIPGIKTSRPDVGGSQGMEQTYMRTHGADDRHTTVQVDGMMVNSSMGDGNIQAYNDDALAQEVSFQTSGMGAEVHWIADYRVVPTILDDQAEAFTLRSFVVQNGEPGAILA